MRLRKVKTIDELETLVDDYQIQSFDLKEKTNRHAIMRKGNFGSAGGHIMFFLFTFWWTFGIGNLLYTAYSYWGNSSEIMIRMDDENVYNTRPNMKERSSHE